MGLLYKVERAKMGSIDGIAWKAISLEEEGYRKWWWYYHMTVEETS